LSPDASWQDYGFNYDLDIQKTLAFGVKFGFTPPPIRYFSFEFEYSYLNPDVDRTVLATEGSDYTAIEGDVNLHNFMFNAIVKYPDGKIHPYVGLGVGVSYFDLSATSTSSIDGVNSSVRRSVDDTVFAWQMMAGVEIDLTNKLSLDIGCRYFDTEHVDDNHYYDDDYYYDHYYDHDHHDDRTLDFKTFMVTLGLKYRF
jgi:opacity protein-like surface antigen